MVTKEKKNSKDKKIIYKVLFIIIILILVIVVIFITPIFQTNTINIEGINKYTKEDIMKKCNIRYGINIFMIRPNYFEKILKKDSYIKSADIKLKYPNEVNIVIKERRIRGYVPYSGAYLYIDEEGRVLDIKQSYTEKLPLVEGLDFEKAKIGEILNVKNEKSFDIVLKTANMMTKYDFIDEVIRIDVSNPEDIHMYIRYVDIMLGGIKDYDFKIRTMLKSIEKIGEKDRGFLDLTNISVNNPNIYPVFRPLN